mgnify:FL=1
MKFYELDRILERDSLYNFIIGERSNGKTTALLRHMIKTYYDTGMRGIIIRQMEEDVKGFKSTALFAAVNNEGMVEELTNGEFHVVKAYNRQFFLGRENEDGVVTYEKEPFAHIVALSQSIHFKSISFPNVGVIVFDEFIRQDRQMLKDELGLFINFISTIVRHVKRAKVFLIANTVSWNSPYFEAMEIRNVAKMKPGDIATVEYPNESGGTVKVSIEYCESTAKSGGKDSDDYYRPFKNNAQVAMITDGGFAVPEYPKCPHHFTSRNVKQTCWIVDKTILRCRLMKVGREVFFFVDLMEKKHTLPGEVLGTSEPDWERYEFLRNKRRDIVYSLEFTSERSHFTDPTIPYGDRRTHWLPDALRANRIFFENSEAGETLMYYISKAHRHSVASL